jgi:hypothetical protein
MALIDSFFGLAHVLERRQTNNEDRGGTASRDAATNMSIDTAKWVSRFMLPASALGPEPGLRFE